MLVANKDLIMRTFLIIISALLAGCTSKDEELTEKLRGTWGCEAIMETKDDAGNPVTVKLTAKTQLMSDNRLGSIYTVETIIYGGKLVMELYMSGEWTVKDSNLEEKISRSTVLGVQANENVMTLSESPQELQDVINSMNESISSYQGYREIVTLEDDVLVLHDPSENSNTICIKI